MVKGQTLFGEGDEPPAPKKKRAKAEPDGTVLRLEAAFVAAHERRWNCTPLIAYGRDRKHLKDLASQLGEGEVMRLIELYFTTSDPQVTRRDYSIHAFYDLAQRLRISHNGAPPVDERTAANLDAAARATGRKR